MSFINESISNYSIIDNGEPVYFYESLCMTFVSIISFITCVVNIVVFSQEQFKEKVFVYLKHESMFMAANMVISMLIPISQCTNCIISKSLLSVIYVLYFSIYITSIIEMSSLISTIMATINCTIMVDRKAAGFLIVFNKINVYAVVAFEIVISALLFLHQIFQRIIVRSSQDEYLLVTSDFNNMKASFILDIMAYTVRDGIFVIILVALNVYLLVIVRRNLAQKRKILTNKKSNIKDPREKKIKQSEKKLVKMVLTDSLVYFLSRMIILVFMVFSRLFTIACWFEIFDIVNILKELSYGIMFFIYFHFNKRFRTALLNFKLFRIFRKQSNVRLTGSLDVNTEF